MYNPLVGFPTHFARGRCGMRSSRVELKSAAFALLLSFAAGFAPGFALAQQMPKLVEEQGRATLMVDGAPYFLLGAQVDNSSGWPDRKSTRLNSSHRCISY